MEKTNTLDSKHKIKQTGFSTNKTFEIPAIVEQLKKISDLKLDELLSDAGDKKFEESIHDIFLEIKNLESHLVDTLAVNNALMEEAEILKSDKNKLENVNTELLGKLSKLEDTTPLVNDIEKRLEFANDEVEKYKTLLNTATTTNTKLENEVKHLNNILKKTITERNDAYKEIVIIENKYESLHSKLINTNLKPGRKK